MRIALTLGTSAGGVGRHVHGLVAEFHERGHEVVVACPTGVERQFGFTSLGAQFVPVDISDRPHPVRDMAARAALRPVIRDADVVHAHGLRAGALACLARRRADTPIVVTLHNAAPEGGVKGRIYRALERVVASRADAVLGVSADLVQRQRELGARHTGLAVIPAPAPPDAVADRATVRASLGIAGDRQLAVVVARLAPQKGLPLLLDATALLRELPLDVVVAGDGPMRAELEERIVREALPVKLIGHRSDVPDLLAAADVVVSSAVWEGQPINLQEALHAGAAIVATDVGGTRAVLADAARLTRPGDSEDLAEGIRAVVADGSERDRLRSHAAERSGELPDAADAADAALEAYAAVARRG